MRAAFAAVQKTEDTHKPNAYLVGVIVLSELFKRYPIDPGYQKFMRQKADLFVMGLLKEPSLKMAHKNWATYQDKQRIKAVKKIMQLQSQVFSGPHFAFEDFTWGGLDNDPRSAVVAEFRGDKLFFNKGHKSSSWNDFPLTSQFAFHEGTHDMLDQVTEAFLNGELPATSVFYQQAKLLADLRMPSGADIYINYREHVEANRNHPEERDVHSLQRYIARVFSSATPQA